MKPIVRKTAFFVALVCALPALADLPGLRYPTDQRSLVSNSTTAGTCEDGATSVAVSTTYSGTVGIDVSGNWSGTLLFLVKTGNSGYKNPALALPVGGIVPVASTTSAGGTAGDGQWTIPVAGNQAVCVAFSSASATGTALVTLNSSTAGGGSSAASGVSAASTAASVYQTGMSSTTQVAGLSGAGLKYYITGFWCSANAAISCGLTSSLTANTACSGGTTVIAPVYIPANGGASPTIGSQPIAVTANSALCCTPSAGTAECQVNYYVGP